MEGQRMLILMECDECRSEWEQEEGENPTCVNCGQEGHKLVSWFTMGRMQILLDEREVEVERLVQAFAACTAGGEGFARAVLERAVQDGRIERVNGAVRNLEWRYER